MNPTKLKQLEKDDLLSQWQKEQRSKGHTNSQFFLKMKHSDPWEKERQSKNMLQQHIPALKGLQSVQWGTHHRRNKDINQQLQNQRIIASTKMVNKNITHM